MKFLVGYNGSEVAKAALSLAAEYAKLFGAKVFVVTSMFGGHQESRKQIEKKAQDLIFAQNFLKERGIDSETQQLVRGRTPGEDLVSFAEENEINQIFVGVELKSRTQKIIVGSNAQYVILKAPCPVVSVNHSFKH